MAQSRLAKRHEKRMIESRNLNPDAKEEENIFPTKRKEGRRRVENSQPAPILCAMLVVNRTRKGEWAPKKKEDLAGSGGVQGGGSLYIKKKKG